MSASIARSSQGRVVCGVRCRRGNIEFVCGSRIRCRAALAEMRRGSACTSSDNLVAAFASAYGDYRAAVQRCSALSATYWLHRGCALRGMSSGLLIWGSCMTRSQSGARHRLRWLSGASWLNSRPWIENSVLGWRRTSGEASDRNCILSWIKPLLRLQRLYLSTGR